ncbi:MAG: ferritin-like domain-containing protein [Firmicutes bacterium]|nr:ferritin-like domain-containing protein [Bacillota bacterium]
MDFTLRVHPELKDDQLLRLFDRGTERQWGTDVLNWDEPETWDRGSQKAMAAVLTPIYLGEQTAMLGVSTMLPRMLTEHEPEAALCLASMGMDEARHFRNLWRLYKRWELEPWSTRQLPEMWRYHARMLVRKDPLDWLWGILISDLFANRFYGQLAERYPNFLIGRLARRTVVDEARHQAFSDRYLTDKLQNADQSRRRELLELREDLFRVMDGLTKRLAAPLEDLGWSAQAFLQALWADTERWAGRIGLLRAEEATS